MTGDRSQLTNFVSKFLGTVKFGNDHVAKIMGYEDYQIGKVLQFQGFNYVEGLFRHNLCSMVKFCIPSSKLCFDGVPLLSCLLFQVLVLKPSLVDGIRSSLYVNFGAINHLARQCLVRGLPKLKFEKDHLGSLCAVGLRAEEPHKPNLRNTNQRINSICIAQGSVVGPNATCYIAVNIMWKVGISHETIVARSPQQNAVATACYTQNRSMIRHRHGKTPYELLHNKPPDLSYLHVFGALCYPTNDSENLGKLQPKADIGSSPLLHEMTPATISSGLVPNPHPSTPFVPPSQTDWDMLFQPLFDEFLNPSPSVDHPAPEVVVPINEVIAPVLADSTGSPSSTTVDQDAPSLIAHMGNDPYFGVPIPEIPSDQSSSSDSIHTIVHPDHQISEHNSKWTKDHPLENIIDELARPVSTRLQLHEQALFCYYVLSSLAVYGSSFPRPDKVMVMTLNAIYKVKLGRTGEEFLKNKVDSAAEPDGFMDIDNPNYVFKLKKALLWVENMTPHAWYDLLSWFLIYHDFSKGSVDPTLFIRREGKELLLVQIYVDDIIFVASTPELCSAYRKGTVHRGLWYPKDSSIALTAFADADHAGCQDTRRSTSGSMQLLVLEKGYLCIRLYGALFIKDCLLADFQESFDLIKKGLWFKEFEAKDLSYWKEVEASAEVFYTSAGNPVKEILLKLNLPDHRIRKDSGEVKKFQRSFRHSDTERLSRSDEVLKLKNFKKDATLKLSMSTNQEWYEHVGLEVTRSQDDKVIRWRNKIMCG
ncbi:retrovirus-related pol polyprotein from transposon TNT 1-94 [Tanacetum coccineum]|uniref:Retrovirus-related pol polyprotein from transposon TNT 1-94 n=1 Tax=Tanacetum coccineum TaxID=301880 RepID=A0ABQ5CUN4_9ASTR